MNPERTLFTLVAIGLVAAGFLYGDYWKKKSWNSSPQEPRSSENTELVRENDRLREELAQVRSLLSGAPHPIPEDLIAFVEKDLNLVFLKAPLAKLGSPSDFRDSAERNLELVYGQDGLGMIERTWELLGLLPAGQNLQSQWIQIETIGARGIFDLEENAIILAEDYNAGNIQDTGALVHLLVRQLLAQNFPTPSWAHEDAWNAWHATTKGAAANVQARYLRRRSAPEAMNRQREDILAQLTPAVHGLANFPYLEGHDFVQAHYLESRDALVGILRTPPLTTLTIINPDFPSPPLLPLPVAKKGEYGNRLGALGLRLLLDPIIGIDLSGKFAQAWRNDDYVYTGDHLRWHLKLNSPTIATEFLEEFTRKVIPLLRETQPDRTIEISRETSRLTLTNSPAKK